MKITNVKTWIAAVLLLGTMIGSVIIGLLINRNK